jgi:hypothetical protein
MIEFAMHALQLLAVFLAFFAAGIAFIIADLTRGGATAVSTRMIALGLVVLAISFFLTYAGVLGGMLGPLNPGSYLLLIGCLHPWDLRWCSPGSGRCSRR